MFATVRTYQGDPGQMDEMLHILDEKFIPQIGERPGLCAYQAVDCGDGQLVTISCFRTREEAEGSTELAAQFVREYLADYDLERTLVKSGQVRVSIAEQEVLEPAHA